MKIVIFLATPGSLQHVAYSILEEMWNAQRIECIYKHISWKQYKRWPDRYDLGISFCYYYPIPQQELNKNVWALFKLENPDIQENEFGGTLYYQDKKFVSKAFREPHLNDDDVELMKRVNEHLLKLFFLYIPDIVNGNKNVYQSIGK